MPVSSRLCYTAVSCAIALVLLASPSRVLAQSPGSNESSTQETPAQELASAPPPGTYETSVTFGVQVKDGRTETRGYTLNGLVAYTTHRGQLLRFDAELTRAEFRPAPRARRLTVDDAHIVSATLLQRLVSRVGFMAVGTWRRDAPLGLDYRVLGQAGVGFLLAETKTLNVMVGPGVGLGRQSRDLPDAPSAMINVGLIQTLTWRVTPTFGVQTYLTAYQDTRDREDHSVALNASGTAMIARHVGLKVYYKYSLDGIHPPTSSASQRELGVGLNFSFRGK